MEKRNSRSLGRRSSILKVDNMTREDDTCTGILFKGRNRSSRRVSFAETYQVKEFPRDSPNVWRRNEREEDEESTDKRAHNGGGGDGVSITGLDTLLTGAIQSQVYEHITECPIPEMSSDSLNTSKLFDINRTVLGPVDMDTTNVQENDIDIPFVDTGQDYSTEIKFDASSFLKNLKGKPSDSLSTMQIFSPSHEYSGMKENIVASSSSDSKKDRSPLKSLSIEQESAENTSIVYPEKPFPLFNDADINFEPVQKIDAKSFLTNLLGPKQNASTKGSSIEEEQNIDKDINNSYDDSMDETTCYGGIMGRDAVRDLTNQITAKMESQTSHNGHKLNSSSTERQSLRDIRGSVGPEKENDTRQLIQNCEETIHQTFAVEETKCHGTILNKPGSTENSFYQNNQENYNLSPANQTVVMEETRCVGGLMNKSMTKELVYKRMSDEKTTVFQSFGMDETKCQGGILNKSNFTAEFDQMNLDASHQVEDMEETKCLTALIDKSRREPMSTVEIKSANQSNNIREPVYSEETKIYQSCDMEETKCTGGILNKTNREEFIQQSPLKSNQNTEMEEMKCLTGLLNLNATDKVNIDNSGMAETSCKPSEIMNRSCLTEDVLMNNQSNKTNKLQASSGVDMNPIAGIMKSEAKELSCQNAVSDESNSKKFNMTEINGYKEQETNGPNYKITEPKAIQEKEYDNSAALKFMESLQSPNGTSIMEETKCVGNIMDKSMTKDLSLKLNLNVTKIYQNVDMEETKCQGGIVSKDKTSYESSISAANQTLEMEETHCSSDDITARNELISKTQLNGENYNQDDDSGEIIFQPKGGVSVAKVFHDNASQNPTENQTVLMEVTNCVGGILNKSCTTDLSPHTQSGKVEENSYKNDAIKMNNPAAALDISMNHSVLMEETKCVGSMKYDESKEIYTSSQHEKTMNQTLPMEMTKCITRSLEDTENNKIRKSVISRSIATGDEICPNTIHEQTMNQTLPMEMTKCITRNLEDTESNKIIRETLKTRSMETGDEEISTRHEKTMNQTLPMEMTKCITRSLEGTDYNEITETFKTSPQHEKTMNQTVPMEMTKCITRSLEDTENNRITEPFKTRSVATGDNKVDAMDTAEALQTEATTYEGENIVGKEKNDLNNEKNYSDLNKNANEMLIQQNVENSKSNFEVLKSGVEQMDEDEAESDKKLKKYTERKSYNFNVDEVTRETTQSITRLQKLKDQLILSKPKTPTHFKRPAEPKTDTKVTQNFTSGSKIYSDDTSSPAHKKKKLFDSTSYDALKTGERTLPTSDIDGYGIFDEQMPELMKMDDLVSVTSLSLISEDSHVANDKSIIRQPSLKALSADADRVIGAVKKDLESEASVTFTSSNVGSANQKVRHSSVASTLSSDDTSSTGNKDTSLYQKQSFMSFTQDSCLSFMVPGDHMTLDMFKKAMMVKNYNLVNCAGRRSSFISPRVDTDDLGEVLLAELTLDPEVKAKMAAYEDIKERTKSNEETAKQLRHDLEETQPQIFQDCVDLDGSELHELRSRVLELHKTCYKQNKLYWVNRTKEAASEALKIIQDKGLSTVSSVLEEIKSDKEQTERLIQSIDDDLDEFMKTTKQLEELEQKRNALEGNLESLVKEIEEQEQYKCDLVTEIDKQNQMDNILQTLENIKQDIKTQLFIQEWDLESVEDNCAVFSFLQKELELRVQFNNTGKKTCIQSVSFQTHLDPGCVNARKRLSHSMALAGINAEMLKKKYSSQDSLPQMLYEVSGVMSEIGEFCADFHSLYLSHDIKVDHRRIRCDFWSLETLDEISVQFEFNPRAPSTTPASIDVKVIMGDVRPEKIVEDLQAVQPGKKYLSRLFSAIRFPCHQHTGNTQTSTCSYCDNNNT